MKRAFFFLFVSVLVVTLFTPGSPAQVPTKIARADGPPSMECLSLKYEEHGWGGLDWFRIEEHLYTAWEWDPIQLVWVQKVWTYEDEHQDWEWTFYYYEQTCTGDIDWQFASDECVDDVVVQTWEEGYAMGYAYGDEGIDWYIGGDIVVIDFWTVYEEGYEWYFVQYKLTWTDTYCEVRFRPAVFSQIGVHGGTPGVQIFTNNLSPELTGVFDAAGNTWMWLSPTDKNLYYTGLVVLKMQSGATISFNAPYIGVTYQVYLTDTGATIQVVEGYGAENALPFETWTVSYQ